MVRAVGMKPIGTSHTVLSRDGTGIAYLSVGGGSSGAAVLVGHSYGGLVALALFRPVR